MAICSPTRVISTAAATAQVSGGSPAHRPTATDASITSRALLGRAGRGGAPAAQGSAAGVACAGPDAEQGLEFPEDGVERQAGAGTFGSRRNCVQNAWARAVSVT